MTSSGWRPSRGLWTRVDPYSSATATTKTAPPTTATTRFRRRCAGVVESRSAPCSRRLAGSTCGPDRASHASPSTHRGQPERDREADRDRGERAPPTRCDGRPPGGQHQQPRREADPERLAGRRVGAQQPDETGDPDTEQQADGAEQQPLADRQPDRAVGQRDPELRKHRRTIPSAIRLHRNPMVRGWRCTVDPPRDAHAAG